jgi:molybdate transport system substrate-binding protein
MGWEGRQVGLVAGRRTCLALALLLAASGSFATSAPGGTALAQGAAIACPEPSPAAASPIAGDEATASSVAADIDFPDDGGELTVFAAASLTDAFEEIATDLEGANEGLEITYNFAGSQALATQLREGAEADVFASANTAQMTAAAENGSIAGEPVTFVRNRLAIVTPAGNPAGIDGPEDLGNPGLKLVLAQAEVPVGRYSREAVCLMGADAATYGDGFVDRVGANIVSEEEDVREVLTKVELGEADAGIVYVSDANVAGDDVRLIDIPDAVNIVATYPIAPVAAGDAALAEAFIAYILGPDGQATLGSFGFEPVS